MKHSTTQQTRRGRGPARRIGRSLALVLPVVLVLSGTLAVTRVNWSGNSSSSVLTASSEDLAAPAKKRALPAKKAVKKPAKKPAEAVTDGN